MNILRHSVLSGVLLLCACGSAASADADALQVALAFDGGRPTVGDNTIIIDVADVNARPMDAEIEVHLHMPAHGHSDAAETEISVTRLATGKYSLSPVRFTMPGEWKVHVHCTCSMGHGETEQTFTVN